MLWQATQLRAKIGRIETMIAESNARRAHLLQHLSEVDAEAGAMRRQ